MPTLCTFLAHSLHFPLTTFCTFILSNTADEWTFDALEAHYKTLVRYLNFRDEGMVLGRGCGAPAMTRASAYPRKAYQLGRGLK